MQLGPLLQDTGHLNMFEFELSLISSVGLICLVVEVREVSQDVSTGGTGETLWVPALLTSGPVSEDHRGAWVDVLLTAGTLPPLPSGQHALQVGKPSQSSRPRL